MSKGQQSNIVANTANDQNSGPQTSANPKTAALPESSFDNLRQKIEGNLKKTEQKKVGKSKTNNSRTAPRPNNNDQDQRGKKRARNGDVKSNGDANQSPPQPRPGGIHSEEEEHFDLKAIVAELGGTEEDIALIEGANSDSELEGLESQSTQDRQSESKKGKTLESGVANILKEIALVRDTYKDCESENEAGDHGKVNGTEAISRAQADDKLSRSKSKNEHATASNIVAQRPETTNKGKTKFIFTPRPDWFSYDEPKVDMSKGGEFTASTRSVEAMHAYGRTLLQKENDAFKVTQVSSSSQAFYNQVIASGTLSDKISALTLAAQESPLHNMKALEGLIGLASKRSRSQAVDVLRALKDLFAQGTLLPNDRKLNAFATQPALLAALGQVVSWKNGDPLPRGLEESHLVVWAFEEWLKGQYFEILKVLEVWCNDEIEFAKTRATSYVYELLKEKPEQEANLLRLLINKLGDPVKKIASQASYCIMQLLSTHPAMKDVVVSTLDAEFIFKPGQSTHSRYYAVVTLNQTALSTKEEEVAIKLLNIYFGLFKLLLKPGEETKKAPPVSQSRHQRQRKQAAARPSTDQEDELQEKLISAVLTGVNRAYPYAGTDHEKFNEHMDTLFQITHSANFNTSIQAMMLIQQLISNTSVNSDRFYRTLYESLLDPRLGASSKQQLYLNLLHRSLKADVNTKRVKAFVKRILQVLSLQEPSFVCGAFFLIKDLEKTFPSIGTMIDQPEEHDDDSQMVASKTDDQQGDSYNASKRAPEHANANDSCLWEAVPFLAHYHPSVSVSADHVLDHRALPGKPDLTLHTMIHFLDRFVYKNAKLSAATKMRGSSIMQPMANEDTRAVLINPNVSSRKFAVNSDEFRNRKDGDVAAEDVFFHRYFKTLGKSAVKKIKKARRGSVGEDGSGASDDEDEVWKAMMNNAPDLEGLGEDDDDDISDISGFEEAMEDDDNASDVYSDGGMDVNGKADEEGSVDVEAGIFDDSENEADETDATMEDKDDESEFGGLSDTEEKAPSEKTLHKREERERKKRLKALPTFATADDYAKMLDDEEDEDLG